MTLQRSHPRAKSRWLTAFVLLTTLTVVGAGLAFAHAGLATAIPANYAGGVQVDVHGANDVPAQSDMTQMGRDTSNSSVYRIFWAWDSISAWTGNGQTGDACALFDTNDADADINFVVCARVANLNANPDDVRIVPLAAGKPVYLFNCGNKKNDRCTTPSPVDYAAGTVLAGQLGTFANGNLITETDPFNAASPNGPGESYPHDSTIDVQIPGTLPPATSSLVNVCSYPSAGNGGNNNPFDCIVTPGVQYGTLRVNKVLTNDNGGTKAVTDFTFKVNGGTSVAFEGDASNDLTVAVGNYSVVEDSATGYATTYANGSNTNLNCTSLAVTAGQTTTCTITNNDNAPALHLRKTITTNSGGTAAATDWTLTATGTGGTPTNLSGTTPVDSGSTFKADTYTLGESGPSNYTAGAWNCGTATMPTTTSVTVPFGGNVTCTINNDDNAPALHLRKTITNDNGGTASDTDWTLTATGTGGSPTNLSGATPVDSGSTFKADTYTLGESGPSNYTAGAWNCGTATMPTTTSVTVPFGGNVTCTINNNDNAPVLHLRKTVTNNSGRNADATDWTLTATGASATPTNLSGSTPVDSGSGFKADTYTLGESGPSDYTAGAWNCGTATMPTTTSVTVPFGGNVTCTINNDDNVASPSIATTMKWTLNDSMALTGFVSGGTASTVTFTLYKDTATLSSCEASTQVYTSGAVTVDDTNGTAATITGYTTEDTGTYRWIASFSGNSFNAAIASDCNSEVTDLP
jgi:hypothetical protein